VRAIQLLRGKPRSAATVRVVGAALAVVAANHLWLVSQVGFGSEFSGSWSIRMTPDGTQLVGFIGWQIFHVILLLVSLALLFGPRRVLVHAATALTLLFAAVPILVVIDMVRSQLFIAQLLVASVIMTLIPVIYRVAARRATR